MSNKENLSFQDGDEEEFHITDDDIDRELAAMDMDAQPLSGAEDSGEQEVMADQPAAVKSTAVSKKTHRKYFIFGFAIIVVLILSGIKWIGKHSSSTIEPLASSASSPAVTTLTEKPAQPLPRLDAQPALAVSVATPVALPVTPEKSKEAPPEITTSAETAKLTTVLTQIQQQNQQLSQQVVTLSQRMVGLESELNQSNQTIQDLSQQMMAPASSAGITGLPPTNTLSSSSSAASAPPMALPPEPEYTVEAVVPQRAWLQTANGNTLTVTVGDDVPSFGAVTAIDPYSGNVSTASGKVIKYGS